MAKIIIFGIQDFAELAHFYLENDSQHEVVAFSVNQKYLPENKTFHNLPVVAFENIEAPGWSGQFHENGSLVVLNLATAHQSSTEYDGTLRAVRTTNPDGTFELTVTDNKGATGKDTVSIIAKQEIAPVQNSINVYPNPVIDFTTLEINTTNNKSGLLIVVTDLQGRTVYTKQIPAGRYSIKEKINMSSFSKSMYLITVHFSSQDKKTLKALKQ